MTTHRRRTLVATAPLHLDERFVHVPHRVAVLPCALPEPALAVLVRLTVPFHAGTFGEIAGVVTPGPFRAVCDPEQGPDDFVPARPAADVLVVGMLPPYPRASGAPTTLDAEVAVGLAHARFVVERDAVAPRRLAEYARDTSGAPIALGPRPTHDAAADAFNHPAAFDYDDYQSADRTMQTHYPDEGLPISVKNLVLGPNETTTTYVPARSPRLLVDPAAAGEERYEVPLDLDTITIDVGRAAVDLTYRAVVGAVFAPQREIDRLILAFATDGEWRGDAAERWDRPLRRLSRGTFAWAEERSDVLAGVAPPPLTENELTMARYVTWDAAAAEPTMELERFVAIQSELAEQRGPRAGVLAAHRLDDYAWNVEERAWTERLADPTTPDRDVLLERYDAARRAEREKHASPAEKEMPVAKYAAVRARVEGRDPMRALQEAGLGLGAWMRIEETMAERADADPVFAEELERSVEAARAEQDARDPIDTDPDEEPAPEAEVLVTQGGGAPPRGAGPGAQES